MMHEQKSPFGDGKGLLAIVIIGIFFVGWQWFMAKNYPPAPKNVVIEGQNKTGTPNFGSCDKGGGGGRKKSKIEKCNTPK